MHLAKQCIIFVTVPGITGAAVKLEQPLKHPVISVTLFGIAGASVRLEHFIKQ